MRKTQLGQVDEGASERTLRLRLVEAKKTRVEEIEEADREIIALGLGRYCSVF
jgi:hypothetical protein